MESRGRVRLAERLGRGPEAERLELVSLGDRPRDETFQVGVGEAAVLRLHLLERAPEARLAFDPCGETLQLRKSRERRVARDLAVQLQPAELLCGPAACALELRRRDSQRPHQSEQRLT